MNPVVQFLTDNPIVYFATCDKDHHPRVRPFQFLFEVNGRLFFCTSNKKAVFEEMHYNPSVELSTSASDSSWIRLRGRVNFSDDTKIKQQVFEKYPQIQSLYETPDNPDFVLFYLANGSATIEDFSGKPPATYAI